MGSRLSTSCRGIVHTVERDLQGADDPPRAIALLLAELCGSPDIDLSTLGVERVSLVSSLREFAAGAVSGEHRRATSEVFADVLGRAMEATVRDGKSIIEPVHLLSGLLHDDLAHGVIAEVLRLDPVSWLETLESGIFVRRLAVDRPVAMPLLLGISGTDGGRAGLISMDVSRRLLGLRMTTKGDIFPTGSPLHASLRDQTGRQLAMRQLGVYGEGGVRFIEVAFDCSAGWRYDLGLRLFDPHSGATRLETTIPDRAPDRPVRRDEWGFDSDVLPRTVYALGVEVDGQPHYVISREDWASGTILNFFDDHTQRPPGVPSELFARDRVGRLYRTNWSSTGPWMDGEVFRRRFTPRFPPSVRRVDIYTTQSATKLDWFGSVTIGPGERP